MTSRACPVCGSEAATVFAEQRIDPAALDGFAFASRKMPEYMHYRLVACPVCDLLYANPVPTAGALAAAYREAAFDSAAEARYASRTYGRLLCATRGRLPDRRGALDIGTGEGAF